MLVQDVMTQHPVTVRPDTGVKTAVTQLVHLGITALPVVDGQGRLCGIVSEADFLEDVIDDPRAHERPVTMRPVSPARTVSDVYTRSAVMVRPRDDVKAVVDLMTAKGFKSVPVVDDQDQLVGIVSRSDIVRALARDDDAIARDVGRLFADLGHSDWTVAVAGGVAEVTGPDAVERTIAHTLCRTVPGVVGVRFG